MRAPLIALILALAPHTAQAQTALMRQIPAVPNVADNTDKPVTCYELDARQGWQRLPLSGSPDALLHLIGPGRVYAMDVIAYPRLANIGWTVDSARYKPVGFMGHTGAEAAALAPFSAYKHAKNAGFGTVLVRVPDGRTGAINDNPELMSAPSTAYVDFRINDSDASLSDNAGFLVLCAVG